jgi:hypothetical protein
MSTTTSTKSKSKNKPKTKIKAMTVMKPKKVKSIVESDKNIKSGAIIPKKKTLTLLDLPQEIINDIAIKSDNIQFAIEFTDLFTVMKTIEENPNILIEIAENDDLVSMKYMINNEIIDICCNMLFMIVDLNAVKIFKYLVIDMGADIGHVKDWAICHTADHGYYDIMKTLLELPKCYRVSVATRGHYAIKNAAAKGHHKIIELLLNPPKTFTKKVNMDIGEGYPIRYAAANGHYKVVELLIQAGCKLTSYCNKALQNAAERNHLDICKILIEAMIIQKKHTAE